MNTHVRSSMSVESLKYFRRNQFYDASYYSANHFTLKEHYFMCLLSQKILKV